MPLAENSTQKNTDSRQIVEWLPCTTNRLLCSMSWLKFHNRITTPPTVSNWCSTSVLSNLINTKNHLFSAFKQADILRARYRANPFEAIGSAFFMNRAALKMANIDAATNYMFTNYNESELLYFADICAGPGGFTQYILWRNGWKVKGFGMTLRGSQDFQLKTNSECVHALNFTPMYGARGDGDIYAMANIDHFTTHVLQQTNSLGVHFMMADGGFSTTGCENMQEILSRRLYTCQCLMALEILRNGGHFVTKVFDLFTDFSVGLIFLMYHCFERVCLFKPHASRPANAERYLICYGRRSNAHCDSIRMYLRSVVAVWERLASNDNTAKDIALIVPNDIIELDDIFCQFIRNSNDTLARKQTFALKKVEYFCQSPQRPQVECQSQLRQECILLWNLTQPHPVQSNTLQTLQHIESSISIQWTQVENIQSFCADKKIGSEQHLWCYALVQEDVISNCCIFAAVGRSKVYRFKCNEWRKLKGRLRLLEGTIIFGEYTTIQRKLSNSDERQVCESLGIIDAYRLGMDNMSGKSFSERRRCIETYCRSLNYCVQKVQLSLKPMQNLQPDDNLHLASDDRGGILIRDAKCDSFLTKYFVFEPHLL